MEKQTERLFKILADAAERGLDNLPQTATTILEAYSNYYFVWAVVFGGIACVATALFLVCLFLAAKNESGEEGLVALIVALVAAVFWIFFAIPLSKWVEPLGAIISDQI